MPIALGRPLVIVIDDDAISRDALRHVFEDWGCSAVAGSTVADVVQALRTVEAPVAAAFIDHDLQLDRDGLAAHAELEGRLGYRIPCTLISASSDPETLRSHRDSDRPVLLKPVPPTALAEALRRCVAKT